MYKLYCLVQGDLFQGFHPYDCVTEQDYGKIEMWLLVNNMRYKTSKYVLQ